MIAPDSDSLIESPPNECERCGSGDLKTTSIGFLQGALASLRTLIRNPKKKDAESGKKSF